MDECGLDSSMNVTDIVNGLNLTDYCETIMGGFRRSLEADIKRHHG